MKDGYGRELDYLRISLTDKCNLRCGYCMPPAGVPLLSHREILTLEEVFRLSRIFVSLGIKKIRLTGGEPLIRKNLVWLIRMLSGLPGLETIALTTNGSLLCGRVGELKEAGLSRINISIDSLREEVFQRLTGKDLLCDVLQGIREAEEEGLYVKLNCVPIRGINEGELIDIARLSKHGRTDVRFIELMPIGCASKYEGIPSEEIKRRLEEAYGRAEPLTGYEKAGPAEYYRYPGLAGRIGLISPMSHPFCKDCGRLRLTAEGYLKLCLEKEEGIDLRSPVRGGASDGELREMIMEAVKKKPLGHSFGSGALDTDKRRMVQIGG
ncbi:MAG: GTP 3',8-cyclase MoaA [Lachnospiraceae bacterium]|nr:GTP 3',8-cyclase MoaA [Lachnospiraceae bacterium]